MVQVFNVWIMRNNITENSRGAILTNNFLLGNLRNVIII